MQALICVFVKDKLKSSNPVFTGAHIDIDGAIKCVQNNNKKKRIIIIIKKMALPEMAKPEKPTARTRNVMAIPFV